MRCVDIRKVEPNEIDLPDLIGRSSVAGTPGAGTIMMGAIGHASCYLVDIKGEVACLYGMQKMSFLSDRVYLWALTTDTVDKNKFLFIRHSQLVIESILRDFNTIIGETPKEDVRGQKWLRWLGAEYDYPKHDLIPFTISRAGFKERRWLTR